MMMCAVVDVCIGSSDSSAAGCSHCIQSVVVDADSDHGATRYLTLAVLSLLQPKMQHFHWCTKLVSFSMDRLTGCSRLMYVWYWTGVVCTEATHLSWYLILSTGYSAVQIFKISVRIKYLVTISFDLKAIQLFKILNIKGWTVSQQENVAVCSAVVNNGLDSFWSLYVGPVLPTNYWKIITACLQHKLQTGYHKTV